VVRRPLLSQHRWRSRGRCDHIRNFPDPLMMEAGTALAPHPSGEVSAAKFSVRNSGALVAIVLVGIALRCWQYLGDDSYFMDEIAILRNLVEKPWRALLTQPLAYGQTAPPGFLAIEKLLFVTLGSTEYSLRLFPLLCSIASVVVFAKLVCDLLPKAAALAALAMFATAGPVILYGAQLKQYSSDILLACLLLESATRYVSTRRRRAAYIFGITGAVAVWLSQPAVIVTGSLGFLLLADEVLRARSGAAKSDLSLLPALVMVGISAACATAYSIHSLTSETRDYLHEYWKNGFLPMHLPTSLSGLWPYAQLHAFYGVRWGVGIMAYPHSGVFTILTAIGLVALVIVRKIPGALVAAPVFFTLIASAAQQYPFADRTILFLLPSFIIALVVSVEALASAVGQRWRAGANILLSGLVGFAAYPVLRHLPPYHLEHLRLAIEYVASHREPGDALYVYHGAVPTFSYYGPLYGFDGPTTILGGCHDDSRQYFREIDQLRGSKRAWIIIGHPLSVWNERDNMLRYLGAIGLLKSTFSLPSRTWGQEGIFFPVEVEEYDLSDLAKADHISAVTFPLLAPDHVGRYRCGFGPLAIR